MKSGKYRFAIYLRLSKEDDYTQDESTSIKNQRLIILNYIKKNFTNYEVTEFSDDGFTGTNLSRPSVTELLDKLRKGRFDCVIVKDFSRFSRDYIELGSYLEQLFPLLDIRFISVNDGYDSKKYKGTTAELVVSFTGLMYDLYSKDLSLKVKSALWIRKEQGKFVSAHCPFGYAKDIKDHHKLVISEEEAIIVRKIFHLTRAGKTSSEIARIFNMKGVKTPIEFKIAKGETNCEPKSSSFQWGISTICSILKNRFYVGDMDYNKYYSSGVGGKNHLKPRSEWKIYPNHHAAIINRELFEEIQKGRGNRYHKTYSEKEPKHPLSGKVVCGGCKKSLTLRKNCLNPYFYCSNRYHYKGAENCLEKANVLFLENVILYRMETELLKQNNQRQKSISTIFNQINELMEEKEKLLREKKSLNVRHFKEYEKYALGESSQFQTVDFAIAESDKRLAELEAEISIQEKNFPEWRQFDNKTHTKPIKAELTREIVEQMIHRIVVNDESHIEIEWNFEKKQMATK